MFALSNHMGKLQRKIAPISSSNYGIGLVTAKRLINRTLGFVCAAGVALVTVIGCKKAAAPSPPVVEVISVTPTNVPITDEWIGTLDGYVNAQIRAQVTGYLLSQNYAEGSEVKNGDLLFQVDPRPFQAVFDQAEAKLAEDKAAAGKTELDVKRYTPLAKEEAISQQELDDAVQANLGELAQIKVDEATVEDARLNLGFTKIASPVDGLAGVAQGQIGDLVSQSGPVLTTVSTINPIKVYFQVSEQSYLTFWRNYVTPGDSAKAQAGFPLQLILSDGSVYPQSGKLLFVNRQVDPDTGTIEVVGLFPNTNCILRPGQYSRVRAQTQIETNAIVVPQRSVTELQNAYQVMIVDEKNTAHLIPVTVGRQIGSDWIIEGGLKAGDMLVVEGAQKAREGTVVDPKPYSE
jgi:RND family efflux transporter MFP subunit